jgi:hypothetical protein
MTADSTRIDLKTLIEEAQRYLAAVDAFRAESAEPTWAREQALPGWWLAEWIVQARSGEPRPAVVF